MPPFYACQGKGPGLRSRFLPQARLGRVPGHTQIKPMPVTWTGSAGVAGSLGAGQLASHLGLSPSSPFPVSDGEPILPATVLSSLARRRIAQSLGSMDPKGTNLGVPTTFSEPAAQGPAGRLGAIHALSGRKTWS